MGQQSVRYVGNGLLEVKWKERLVIIIIAIIWLKNWTLSSERVTGSERAYVEGIIKRAQMKSFSGGPVIKNLPANAEDMGVIPAPGRFHMPTCRNYCNPSTPESMLHNKRNQRNVGPVHCNQRVAPALGN